MSASKHPSGWAAACSRAFELDAAAVRAEDGGVPVVVSTDAAVPMHDGPEILVHSADAVDLRRAPLPIIVTHQAGQINIGIVDQLQVGAGQLRGVARFGQRPEAAGYAADVANGTLRSVSVGYRRVHGRVRKADGVLITDRWMPTHVAIVAEPADHGAGFYRADDAPATFAPEVEASCADVPPAAMPASTPGATMADHTPAAAAPSAAPSAEPVHQPQANAARSAPAAHQGAMPPAPQGTPGNAALEHERARRRGIENLCRANNIPDETRDYWIGAGLSLDRVSDDLLVILQERGERNPQSVAKLDLTSREVQSYSLQRAILACATNNWGAAGFELEASREIASRLNVAPNPNRFYVPLEIQTRAVALPPGQAGARAQRDLGAGTPSAGGYLVQTDNVSFIDMLRNRSVAYRMGAMRLSGLKGNVTVPRQTGAATWYWLASETTQITESQQVFGQLPLSPKTGGAYTEISRQLLMQSSPGVESIVTMDLGRVGGLGIDSAVLAGSGANGQPTGITNTAGIGSVTGTTLGYAGILEFQSDIAVANVLPTSGGYVTTPAVAALMMQRVKFSGTASPLWDGNLWDGQMAGFAAMSSNQMAAATMLFGDWSSVVVAEWGVLEIETNPYANFQAGIIGVRAMVSMDCGLRYPAAFSLANTIT